MVKQINDEVSGLKSLGAGKTEYPGEVSRDILETFPNKFPHREYQVSLSTEEFTSLCPKTGQPDFGTIRIQYVPDLDCIESKSLKLYLFSYRNEPTFMETVTNRILDDLVEITRPRQMQVTGEFKSRGGIAITVTASYER